MMLPSSALRMLTLGALLAAGLQQWTHAADERPPAPVARAAAAAAVDKLAVARGLITAKRWPAALDELQRVNEVGSADWNNLMGYTLRNAMTPDLDAAQRHYDEALRIDPRHRNALEYSGQLYLMKGELAKAEARLAALAVECSATPCQQHGDLKYAIQRYKAAGNKYLAPN